MTFSTIGLTLKLSREVPSGSPCLRPPSWPPPPDWVVSLDTNGNPLSRWGEPVWDLSRWAGKPFSLDFAKTRLGRGPVLSAENQHQLKVATTWLIWGPQGAGSCRTLSQRFNPLRRIVIHCEKNRILASDLWRFPAVLTEIAKEFKGEHVRGVLLVVLDRLYRAREALGFILVDEPGIRRLTEVFSGEDSDDVVQTAYIPPRIWTYQVMRLRECIDDFLAHQQSIEACFRFCIDAYIKNYGSLAAACANEESKGKITGRNPFTNSTSTGARTGCKFYGPFEDTARAFSIDILLRKWAASPTGLLNITQLTSYLSLIQRAGLTYIGVFTLQRRDEFASSRSDCLKWEEDDSLGRIPTICGETTKTDPDSDARWPCSPSVEVAVRALAAVAKLRLDVGLASGAVGRADYDATSLPLLTHTFEPWSPNKRKKLFTIRPNLWSYGEVAKRYPHLFDLEEMRITQEDLNTALLFTPNLKQYAAFAVGKTWPLAYHQNRRTGAVNMFASGILSDSSMQVILKHLTIFQSRYYGKNFSRLRFNQEWEAATVAGRYEVMARQVQAITGERYVSPYGEQVKSEIVLNLVGQKDFDQLVKEGIKGNVSFRAIRLGGCTNREHCSYGGIESISRCTGGDGDKPCRQVIYDKKKRTSAQRQLDAVEQKLKSAQLNSQRARALEAEAQGLRNFLNDTK